MEAKGLSEMSVYVYVHVALSWLPAFRGITAWYIDK